MKGHADGDLESRVEAAFERFNRAVLAGAEPKSGLFIESLEAEGVRLSLDQLRRLEPATNQASATPKSSREGAAASRGRAGALLARRVAGRRVRDRS